MARLIMRRGPTRGAIYELQEDVVSIGRGAKNSIIIHDNEVSREHCRLIRVVDDYELEDLNSSNGTYINGQRVAGNWLLQPGFLVELGETITLEYERGTPGSSTGSERETQEAPPQPVETFNRSLLMITQGPDSGHSLALTNRSTTIGRDLSNELVIQDPEVSRFHVRIQLTNKGHVVEDIGSTNGTTLNNEPLIDVSLLQHNDVLRLGTSVVLQYVIAEEKPFQEIETRPQRITIDLSAHNIETNKLKPNGRLRRTDTDEVLSARQTSMLGTGVAPGELHDHLFVAYAREEWESVVAALTLNLQDAGLSVWVDQYLLLGGSDWRDAVEQALYECWLMVVVVTPQSLDSTTVRAAWRYFVNRDKPLILLLSEAGLALPVELTRQRTIIYDAADPTRTIHKLIFEIKELRKQRRPT
jgi:pSer/pThr/pTyr-binding forkhead associated (FHA) protein